MKKQEIKNFVTKYWEQKKKKPNRGKNPELRRKAVRDRQRQEYFKVYMEVLTAQQEYRDRKNKETSLDRIIDVHSTRQRDTSGETKRDS